MEGDVEMKPLESCATSEEETDSDMKTLDWKEFEKEEGNEKDDEGEEGEEDKPWTPYEDSLPFRLCPCIESRYLSLRSILSRPFEYRISFLPYDTRGCTVLEILLAAAVIAYITMDFLTFITNVTGEEEVTRKMWKRMVKDTGNTAYPCFIACFLLGARNSFWSYLLGVPFERQLRFHKFLAVAGMAATGFHGGLYFLSPLDEEWQRNTGLIMVGCLAGIYLTSFFLIRRFFFEFFLFSHVLFFTAFAIVGTFHETALLVGLFMWTVDIAVRAYFVRRYNETFSRDSSHLPPSGFIPSSSSTCTATLSRVTPDVVQITIPNREVDGNKTFVYRGGQYFFLCLPSLSLFQWHPLSLSSSLHHANLTFHVRAVGGWTNLLLREVDAEVSEKTMPVYLDGPYGDPMINMSGGEYKCFLFIAGGIGVMPLLSMYNSLLNQRKRGRPISKVYFVWILRSKDLRDALYPSCFDESTVDVTRDTILSHKTDSPLTVGENRGDVCHVEVYLTASAENPDGNRPDLNKIFERMHEMCLQSDERKIGVATCGPSSLMSDVRDCCTKFSSCGIGTSFPCTVPCSSQFAFDFHQEAFEF